MITYKYIYDGSHKIHIGIEFCFLVNPRRATKVCTEFSYAIVAHMLHTTYAAAHMLDTTHAVHR